MKANELMIGDWVKFPISYEKIQEISYQQEIGGYCVWFAASATLFPCKIEDIEPIPLTPEILEKNGFIDEMSNHAYKTDNYHVCYYCADERLSINKYGAILDVYCFYVHQLQHALRLCGVSKEIEL